MNPLIDKVANFIRVCRAEKTCELSRQIQELNFPSQINFNVLLTCLHMVQNPDFEGSSYFSENITDVAAQISTNLDSENADFITFCEELKTSQESSYRKLFSFFKKYISHFNISSILPNILIFIRQLIQALATAMTNVGDSFLGLIDRLMEQVMNTNAFSSIMQDLMPVAGSFVTLPFAEQYRQIMEGLFCPFISDQNVVREMRLMSSAFMPYLSLMGFMSRSATVPYGVPEGCSHDQQE